jgi:signal transduction histidine kinase
MVIVLDTLLAENWRKEADSLEFLLANEKTDTGKIELYITLNSLLLSNKPEKAFEYALVARKIAEGLNDTARIIRSILRECDFYTQMGDYSVSLENAYHGIDLAGKDKRLLTLCHNRIANIHTYLKNHEEALYHHRKSMNLDKEIGDTENVAIDYCNMGTCFADMSVYDSALYYLRTSNSIVIRHSGRPDPYSLSHIGNTYAKMKNFDSAIYYHLLAYRYDSLDEQQYEMSVDEFYIANTYFEMHNYSKALKYAFRSVDRAKSINLYDIPLFNYEILSKIYKEEGNYHKAFEYAIMMNALKDTLRYKSSESLILGLETKYKVKEQESKLKAKELEMQLLERQKTLFVILSLISVLFVLSLVITMVLIYRRQRANRELMHQLKLSNNSKERLISIISHDLRGSVGTLRSAAKAISEGMTDIEDTRALLESFYPIADSTFDLLENLLTWAKYSKEKLVPSFDTVDIREIIEKSIKHINHLAASKSININNHVVSALVKADKNMMLAVVRNLLSNAIKFSHPNGEVNIQSELEDEKLIISFEDHGLGMSHDLLSKVFELTSNIHTPGTMGEGGSGLGLSICRTFVQKHGGKLWAKSTEGKGSTFYYSLPLKR